MRPSLAALLLASVALPAAAADLPVRSVTLSSAGVAQVERAGPVEAGAVATFRLPLIDVDDLLRSLSVADPAGAVVGVRLPAQDLLAEAFRGLPLRPDDFSSRVALLGALRGQQVLAGGAEGRIADVAEAEEGALRLTLITAEGLRSVTLSDGDAVRFADTGLGARIARAGEAMAAARSADERQIEIALTGDRRRDVSVGYVAGAPVWKPSYRLFVPALGAPGEARIQAWAVVENATGSDWDDVALTLVSGEAAAFQQALYTPIRPERPRMPVRVADAVRVQADTGARPPPPPASAPMAMAAPMMRSAAGAPATAMAEASAIAAPAIAAASAGRVAFRLPQPIGLRAGQTANLPFLDARIPAERVWWVQDLSARNPLAAVRVTNGSGSALPDALASVFGNAGAEAGGYLGDAEVRAWPVGDQRLLAFARDRDVQITPGGGSTDRPIRVERRRGGIWVTSIQRQEVSLAVDPKGTAGPMLIDLARRPGMSPRFTVAAEGDFGLRHEVRLDGRPVTLTLAFERETSTEIRLWDAGLGDPPRIPWRGFDLEQNIRRLPGGPGTLESLRTLLERLPADAPGRPVLAETVTRLAEARVLLDTMREKLKDLAAAEAALARARQAADDRSGPERETARRRLNEASLNVERAGAAADAAWEAWTGRVQVLTGG
ncbi:DUF4139 domain-containing protein [Humitalea sp. 24SJ18S-53]|uniref:DUF4139 domain-containing protein n=1 Tax=Humitalea sp. 24SJ18S-53 TaxID=3422307 RepID=UPI003D66E35E